jgi:hypothetical protein
MEIGEDRLFHATLELTGRVVKQDQPVAVLLPIAAYGEAGVVVVVPGETAGFGVVVVVVEPSGPVVVVVAGGWVVCSMFCWTCWLTLLTVD